MTINDAIRIVRERYRIVLFCLLLGLIGAGATVALSPREYAADIPFYVSVVGRVESSDDAYSANQLAKARVASYTPLIRDKRITQAVIDKLQLPMTVEQLAKHLTVTVAPDAAVMTATVTDPSPQRAATIANAVAQEFVGLVNQLEQPIGPPSSPTPTSAPARTVEPGSTTARTAEPEIAAPASRPAAPPTQIRAQIIRPAITSPIPVSPNVPLGVGLGAGLGLLIGVGAAFLSNARDTTVRDPERLQKLTSAPVLARIPADRTAKTSPIAFDRSIESPRAEAYRRLRTNLKFHHHPPRPNPGARVVVVTSAGIGEGTSLTACNLARALATGSQVMLVDANLRHPQVDTYLSLDSEPGLTNVLTGDLTWPLARRRLSHFALEVLTSGPVAPRQGEFLTWHRMGELLHEMRKRYDFVIIDAPALGPVADAAAVAARADGVILVVRHRVTTEEQVATALDALSAVSAPLLGTVLNMAPASRPRRGTDAYAEQSSPGLPWLSLVSSVRPMNRPLPPGRPVPGEAADASTDAVDLSTGNGDASAALDRVEESGPDLPAR